MISCHQRPIEAVELGGVVDRQPRETAALGPFLALAPSRSLHRPNRLPLTRRDTRNSGLTNQTTDTRAVCNAMELLLPLVHSESALMEGERWTSIEDFERAARNLWRAERAGGQEAAEPVRQALPRLHRAVAVSGHRLLGPVGPLRRFAQGRCAGLCPGLDDTDAADPRPARQQPRRHDRQSAGAARRRADLFRARDQRDAARQRPGAASPPIPRCSNRSRSTARCRAAASWSPPRRSISIAARR